MIKTTYESLVQSLPENDESHHFLIERVEYADEADTVKGELSNFANVCQFEWDFEHFNTAFVEDPFRSNPQMKAAPLLLTKRNAFKFEEEVRLLCYSTQHTENKIYEYPIEDWGSFIKEVVLDPWSPDGIDSVIKDIIGKYIPDNNIPVITSKLYKEEVKGILYDPYQQYSKYAAQHNLTKTLEGIEQ